MHAIEIENLRKVYRDRKRREVIALDTLCLEVARGEVFGFLGPNGAGKSTTIKTLVSLIKPTSGTVRLFGASVQRSESRRRVGYLPENPAFYDYLSAREYLVMVGQLFGMDRAVLKRECDRVLELLDLLGAEKRPMRTYSKGMVQRLGLAQTLLHDPDLYILDEPMSGLDPVGRALVKEIMRDLKQRGKTVFFSTHVTADVEAVCDRVAVITSGKLQSVNNVRDLLDKGIEGYSVQFSDCELDPAEGFEVLALKGGLYQVFVPRADLNRFMTLIAERGGEVHLVETRRHDLEKFFLDIVQSDQS